MSVLLHVYDSTVGYLYESAFVARVASHSVGVASPQEFWSALDGLIAQGKTFDAMVVSSHGQSGAIFLGDDKTIDAGDLHQKIGKAYDKLFPAFSKIYFVGCSIAEDDARGFRFLETAGAVFLRRFGGLVMGHSTDGRVVGGPVQRGLIIALTQPFLAGTGIGLVKDFAVWFGLKGKIFHFPWDDLAVVTIGPGGLVWSRKKM